MKMFARRFIGGWSVRNLVKALGAAAALLCLGTDASAAMTVAPVTWNVIGLDSNSPAAGPQYFPLGARVCSSTGTAGTPVTATLVWDSANANIEIRSGAPSALVLPALAAGACADAFFEVGVNQVAGAYDTSRRYHVVATAGADTASSTTPREIYVEHLISQSRNAIADVKFGSSIATLTSVPAGAGMNLVVGNTYYVQLLGGTATQGYNQFEAFINFPSTIFQILSVSTTYSADDSPFVPNPNDKLYADACGWENDPNSPSYRACVGGDFKAGGSNVVTTYQIKVLSGGGTSQTLNTLLYDFSGSSFHYNADYAVGARIANIIDPTNVSIAKSFSPNPAPVNGVSALTFTLGNPNPGTLGGYNFVDNLPAGMTIANPNGATTSGCGTPTLTAVAGSSQISFSNGTLAANSTCILKVNVTTTATGTYNNTTSHLFIDSVDSGKTASASLTVNNAPPPGSGLCNVTLAGWTFPSGFTLASPAASTGTGTATAGSGLTAKQGTNSSTTADGTASWGSNGNVASGATLVTSNNDYLEFAVNASGLAKVSISFDAVHLGGQGPTGLGVFYSTDASAGTSLLNQPNALPTQNSWVTFGSGSSLQASPVGSTFTGTLYFRIYAFNAGNQTNGSDYYVDNVSITGCADPVKPTIAKAFSPNPVAVNGISTLTFTLTNTNTAPLTGAKFTDTLPSGVVVASPANASTTCTGGPTWAPVAGASSVAFGQITGGTIPASGSCTARVDVQATTSGPHTNISDFLSTTEGGTNTSSVATASLTAVLPPVIEKHFSPSPIVAGGTATLTFSISNPNQNDTISSVAFTDTFPVAPGAMVVAPVPGASTAGCGAPVFAPVVGSGSISFTGGTIAGGAICTVTVDVTAPAAGTYTNTSGVVSHVINGATVNGNSASDSLSVVAGSPSLAILKEVAASATGPWEPFLPRAVNDDVYYRVVVENTGNVPLTVVTISDPTLPAGAFSTCTAATLPVAVAANDNHLLPCVAGPFPASSGLHTNTATASATNAGLTPKSDSATYATTGLTLAKSSTEAVFQVPGDVIHYSYLVTNSGFATLDGPVTVSDNKTTVTCPALTTVGDLDNFLDPGEAVTCTATYTITGADIANASVTNTASASAGGVTSNNASRTVVLSTSADVSMTKTPLTGGPFTAGQTISYALTAANAGPSAATNIQVTDTPSNLTITNVSGSGCAALPCTIASLASGANTTITVTATITAAGAFDNSATATAVQPDPDITNNTDSTGNGGTAAASADVSLVKSLTTAGPYTAGQSIGYTLVVANAGPSTATNVQVTDSPSNLTITNVSGSGCAALPCTIASLASGASTSITVTAAITAAGAFDNSATATPAENDPDTSNNTDSTGNGGNAAASADVSMVKTLITAGPYTAGQSLTFTLVVANAGPSPATNVQVTDTPSSLTITNVSGAGCAAMPCTIVSLASGASTTITVTATINATGAFDNAATATATENDPNPSNNTDNSGNGGTASPSADVSMVKTLTTGGPYTIGQTLTYTLLVANAGPSTATNVQVTDTPSSLTLTSVSGSGCAALPCTIASLASGASTTITVTATINTTGSFDNTATATATESDPNLSNNTDNSGNGGTAAASADVSMVKTLTTAGPYTAGQSISYTLLVANAGPSTATNVQVTDAPSGLSITSVSGAGCAAMPCTIASLASGASTTITVTATITAAWAFDNSATATAAEADPNLANNTDSTGNGGTATPSADVSLVKTLTTSGPYSVGQTLTYTLAVANAGPSTATNIQVTDTPSNLAITSVSGAGCAAMPCTIASLASGANTTITVTATITVAGAFDNSATATATESDPNPANNTDANGNGGSTTAALADVSLVKTLVDAAPFTQGQSLTYTLVVGNAGPATATSLSITDSPTNLTITNVSGAGCAALPCSIASLASGATATITVTATINAAGAFDNSATATAAESDPNLANNTDSSGNGGTAAASADLAIAKSANPTNLVAGDLVTFAITVTNGGPSTATGITVSDVMPAGLLYQSDDAAGSYASGTGVWTLPAPLATGASATLHITAKAQATGVIVNTASITASSATDPNSANDQATATVIVAGPPRITASKTASLAVDADGNGFASPGDTLEYSIAIRNDGGSDATAVAFTDLPDGSTTIVPGSVATTQGVVTSGTSSVAVTIGVLPAGATATVTFRVVIDNPAGPGVTEVSNQGQVSSAELPVAGTDDPGTIAPGDPTVVPITSAPVLSADKSAVLAVDADANGVVSPGDTLQYTVVLRNSGNGAATNVRFNDTPGANTSLVAGSVSTTIGTITSSSGAVAVNVGTLPGGGATATIRFRVAIVSPLPPGVTSVSNQGTLSSDQLPVVPTDDPDTGAPGDPTSTHVTAAPAFLATKAATLATDADGDGVPSPGDTLLYTVSIRNVGNGGATGVVFTDTPGANTTLVSGSVQTSAGVVTGNSGTVVVSIGAMAGGATVTITFRVTIVNPTPAGVVAVSNQGTLSSNELPAVGTDDPDTLASGDPTITAVTAAPRIAATKTSFLFTDSDLNGVPSPGDTLLYTITVTNSGNTAATAVVVNDVIAANTSIVAGSVQTSAGSVVTGNGAGDTTVRVNAGDIAGGGGSVTITFRVQVANPLAAGTSTISNQGVISGTNFPSIPTDDPATPAPGDPTVTPVTSGPRIAVSKSASLSIDADGNGVPSPGDTLLYTVVIVNSGNGAAAGVVFSDAPDANTVLVPGSVQTTSGTITSSSGSVGVNVGTIPGGGASATITFRVTVAMPLPAGVALVANQGVVSGSNFPSTPTDDPSTPAPSDPTVTVVTAAPRISARKSAALVVDADGNGVPSAGDTLVYTITVANSGNTPATGIVVDDTPDPNTQLVTGSVLTAPGTVVTGNTAGDSTVTVNVGTLPPGTTVVVSFRVSIRNPLPSGVTSVSNHAVVTGGNIPPTLTDDPTTPAGDDPTVTPVGPAAVPQLAASKTAALVVDVNGDGAANPGDTLQYTIIVRNSGTGPATGVVVLDTPGASTLLVAGSVTTTTGTVTTGNAAGSSTVRVDVGGLSAGASCTVVFRAIVGSLPAGVTTVANQATISSGQGSTSTDDPATPASGDPTLFPVAPPAGPGGPVGSDVSVTKIVDVSHPAEGGIVHFTIRATNLGASAVSSVWVNEPLPAGLVLANATATAGTYNTAARQWQVGTLAAGSSATLTVTARVAAGTAGRSLTNCVALAIPDSNPANDRACAAVVPRVTPQPAACTNYPPVLSVPSLVTAEIGSTLHFTVAATDPEGEPVTLSAAGLPTNAKFDAATGEFTFTPSDGCDAEDEAYAPTFLASDARGSASSAPVRITVVRAYTPRAREVARHDAPAGPLPLISIPQGVIGDESGAVRFTVVAHSHDRDCRAAVRLLDSALGRFDEATGLFTWGPAFAVPNPVTIVRFAAVDCDGRTSTASVPVRSAASANGGLTAVRRVVFADTPAGENRGSATLSLTNSGSAAVTIQSIAFRNGDAFRLEGALRLPLRIEPSRAVDVRLLFEPRSAGKVADELLVKDGSSAVLAVAVEGTGLPPSGVATVSTNDVSFSPNVGYVDRGVILQPGPGSDGGTCPGAPPVLSVPPPVVAEVGRQLRFRVAAIDPDGDAVSLGVATLPPGAMFDPASGLFTFTPTDECGARASRRYDVTFVAADSSGSKSSAPVQITVVAAGSGMGTTVPLISVPAARLSASSATPLRLRVAADAGQNCSVTLSRAGQSEGRYNGETGEYVFAASGGMQGSMPVSFVATACDGSTARALVQVDFGDGLTATAATSVRAVDFTPAAIGSRNGYVVIPVVNHGNKPLAITAVRLAGGADFRLDGVEGLPLVLRPGHELPLRVELQPKHAGRLTDQLLVTTSDPQTPKVVIDLTGEGLN